jgi:hypothetical protein
MAKRLDTVLSMDMTGFRNGMTAAQRSLRKFNKDIGRPLAKGAKQLGRMTAMASAMAGAFAALQVNSIVQAGAELDDMAQKTGMSAEFLGRLGYAAKKTGAESSDLINAFRRISVTTAAAATGSKSAKDALAAVGLSFQHLANLSPDQKLAKVIEKLTAIKDPSARAAAGFKLLGRSAMNMMPLIAEGADGIKKLMNEQARLEGVWTEKDIAMAAMFKDLIYDVRTAFRGLMRSVFGLETINRALLYMQNVLVDLRNNPAFADFVQRVKAGAENFVKIAFGMALAIYNFATNMSDSMKKLMKIFALTAIAFKTGLAIPLLKLGAMAARGLVATMLNPIGLKLAAITALSLGAAAAIRAIAEGTSFREAFGANIDFLKKKAGEIFDMAVPADVKQFIDDMKGIKDFELPELPEMKMDMGEIGMNIEDGAMRGVEKGLRRQQWGRIFRGGDAMTRTSAADKQAEKTAMQQFLAQQETNMILNDLRRAGALIF